MCSFMEQPQPTPAGPWVCPVVKQRGAQDSLEIASTDMLIYGDGYLKATHQYIEKDTGPTT